MSYLVEQLPHCDLLRLSLSTGWFVLSARQVVTVWKCFLWRRCLRRSHRVSAEVLRAQVGRPWLQGGRGGQVGRRYLHLPFLLLVHDPRHLWLLLGGKLNIFLFPIPPLSNFCHVDNSNIGRWAGGWRHVDINETSACRLYWPCNHPARRGILAGNLEISFPFLPSFNTMKKIKKHLIYQYSFLNTDE